MLTNPGNAFQKLTSPALSFFWTLFIFVNFAFGQTPDPHKIYAPALLELNKPIERKISDKSEKQTFQISLIENQFAKIIINQREIDVKAQLIAPDGNTITDFDYEPRLKETEEIKFVAPKTGVYLIDITAKYKNSNGLYEIQTVDLHDSSARERDLFQAQILRRESEKFELTGKYNDALSSISRALEIASPHLAADDAFIGFILIRLGGAQRRRGDFSTAETTLQRALAINEKALGSEHPQTVDTLRQLGLVYLSTDSFEKADKLFQACVERTTKTLGADHPRMAYYFLSLQVLGIYLGDLKQGEKYGQQALTIAEKNYDSNDVLMTFILNNLGYIYLNNKDFKQAETLFRKVLGIYEQTIGTENNDYALTLQNLGGTLYRQNNFPQAMLIYERALAIREKTLGKDHLNLTPLLINIGNIHQELGDYAKSVEFEKRAFEIAQVKGGLYHEYTFTALGNIANSYLAKNDIENSLGFQTLAQERRESALALNLAIGSERLKLIQVALTAKSTSDTISLNVNFAPNNQRASALAALVILQRKGRVLDAMSESFASLRKRAAGEDQKLLDHLKSVTEELAAATLEKSSRVTLEEQKKQIEELTEKKENIEAAISRRNSQFRAVSKTVTLNAVREQIPADAALVEYAVYKPLNPKAKSGNPAYGNPRYVAYVLKKTGDISFAEIGDKEAIDKTIAELRTALRDANRTDVKKLAQAADEKIMKPVRALLGNARRIFVSPDGDLNLLPFETLVDEKGNYLIEKFSFNYLTSGRDLLRLQENKGFSSINPLIIANPIYGETSDNSAKEPIGAEISRAKRRSITTSRNLSETYFSSLPNTVQEAREIQSLFPNAKLLTREQATESLLKQTAAPQILHLATHGFFLESSKDNKSESDENPLLSSGLAFTGANIRNDGRGEDGILTALEASGLNLWGTKLVVLSACESGLGEIKTGEGVYGLRRAFVLAGAESLVMSLWAVSDYATRKMMTDFYTNLKNGQGRGESLRQAKLAALKTNTRRHPFYWAAFIETGEWANLEGKR